MLENTIEELSEDWVLWFDPIWLENTNIIENIKTEYDTTY